MDLRGGGGGGLQTAGSFPLPIMISLKMLFFDI